MDDTFTLRTDTNTGMKFIMKIQDKEAKNHKEFEGYIETGFMPEMPPPPPLPTSLHI